MLTDFPHRRFNPLTGSWVLVSPQRRQRPWQGKIEELPAIFLPEYEPGCYLCPGNSRAGGRINPAYESTFAFDNDFPALSLAAELPGTGSPFPEGEIFAALASTGVCRVVCFSPRHDLTLPELPVESVQQVVQTWADETEELRRMPGIRYVQVFENKGEMMGCSNPHPHSQVWATSFLPDEAAREQSRLSDYLRTQGGCLVCKILEEETRQKSRLVAQNNHFTALVPFWAVWPFEILVISHRHTGSLPDLEEAETMALAEILQQVTTRYDNLFEVSFPYSMGFHQAPGGGQLYPENHLHAHFYPPLLRSATVKKYMVGFEMLAMPQRDLTPEQAAEMLAATDRVHYRSKDKAK